MSYRRIDSLLTNSNNRRLTEVNLDTANKSLENYLRPLKVFVYGGQSSELHQC